MSNVYLDVMSGVNLNDIAAWAWLLWAACGIVSGLVAAMAVGGSRAVWVDMAVGLIGSLVGACGYAMVIGLDSQQDVILSTLCGVFLAGVMLWIVEIATDHTPDLPGTDDDIPDEDDAP